MKQVRYSFHYCISAGSILVKSFIHLVAPKGAVCFVLQGSALGALPTDSAGKLDVFGHDGNTFGVDGAQVGVLKQTNKVGLAGFLKGHHSRTLEA